MNLLVNAIEFTNDGGYVTVSATPLHAVDAGTRTGNGVACTRFSVIDTGIGMSDTSRIFAEGVKLDRTAPTRDSAGIGLTFCKRIVEAHGSMIWVESQPGIGSRFHSRSR